MSIALVLSSVTPELSSEIKKKCIAKPSKTQFNDDPDPVPCFAINRKDDTIYIPLGVWSTFLDEFPDKNFPKTNVRCKKTPYTIETDPKGYRDQDVVIAEAIERLENDHTVFIACPPGYGKTTIGNYLTGYTKLKTAVLCHLDAVNEQWVEEYNVHSTAKVQRVSGNKPLDPSADVYVIGVRKALSLRRECFENIGLVIFDEAHIATITAFSKSMLKFQPRYIVGLSATPKRADGMHKLLTMYFGPQKSFISRHEIKDFTVYKVQTPYVPEVKYTMVKGKVVPDWSKIINSIAANTDRHDLIISLCDRHPQERILILSDRQIQSNSIYDKLVARKESVQLLIGNTKVKKITDESLKARIIVGGAKKVGTGFDDPTLTVLIIASDCKNVAQWEGRLRTVNCTVYDVVDDYKTFENHYANGREPYYAAKGADIKLINFRTQKKDKGMPSRRFLGKNKIPYFQ